MADDLDAAAARIARLRPREARLLLLDILAAAGSFDLFSARIVLDHAEAAGLDPAPGREAIRSLALIRRAFLERGVQAVEVAGPGPASPSAGFLYDLLDTAEILENGGDPLPGSRTMEDLAEVVRIAASMIGGFKHEAPDDGR